MGKIAEEGKVEHLLDCFVNILKKIDNRKCKS